MLAILLGLGIPLFYLTGVAVTARILHVKLVSSYLRWKNEDPHKEEMAFVGPYDYPRVGIERRRVSEVGYRRKVYKGYSRALCWVWPFIGPYTAIHSFCFPPVKLPDQVKIKELEKL